MDAHNPLIPAGYDVVWSVVAVLIFTLTVIALITLARASKRLTVTQALVWAAIVLLVPVLGAVAWLAVGRRARAASLES